MQYFTNLYDFPNCIINLLNPARNYQFLRGILLAFCRKVDLSGRVIGLFELAHYL